MSSRAAFACQLSCCCLPESVQVAGKDRLAVAAAVTPPALRVAAHLPTYQHVDKEEEENRKLCVYFALRPPTVDCR